jgi:hypothetical protein
MQKEWHMATKSKKNKKKQCTFIDTYSMKDKLLT